MLDAIIIGDITDVEMVMKAHTKNGKKASIVFPIVDPDSLSIELSRVEMRGDVGNNVIETGDIVCKIQFKLGNIEYRYE